MMSRDIASTWVVAKNIHIADDAFAADVTSKDDLRTTARESHWASDLRMLSFPRISLSIVFASYKFARVAYLERLSLWTSVPEEIGSSQRFGAQDQGRSLTPMVRSHKVLNMEPPLSP